MMSLLGSRSAKKAAKQAAKKSAKKPAKKPAPEARRGVAVEKPKANIYTVLLTLSFVAVLIGCLCLSLEMNAYNWEFKAR
jgi:hypothetical protein